eukprot:12351899-Heterocapsa_arctica.AAC.1
MVIARGLPDGPVPPKNIKTTTIIKQKLKSYSRSIIGFSTISINAPTVSILPVWPAARPPGPARPGPARHDMTE